MKILLNKKSFLGLAFVVSFSPLCAHEEADFKSVEHKNPQLNLYLDLIRYNCQEKIGILPYILKNNHGGQYLEIGTGGDPIAKMFDKIPPDSNVTIVASDIDEDILKSLPIRHPSLKKYINRSEGPKLILQKLNAVNMGVFDENSFDGINASSILHEIFSYELGFEGIEKFFKESFRTLKDGGILVYRDPEAVSNKNTIVTITLKNKSIRLFAHIFIYKFLDQQGSLLGQTGRKVKLYRKNDVIFSIYKKNNITPSSLTYDQYLQIPSYDIDFFRSYKITLPLGLYRELARHYLTYLHQCNPLAFLKCTPDISSGSYNVNYFAHSTVEKLQKFLSKYNWQVNNGKIGEEQKNKIEKAIDKNTKVLEFGIPFNFNSNEKKSKLRSLIKKHDFAPESHIIALENGNFLLDYRVFGILYDEIKRSIFDQFNNIVNQSDEVHAKWLKREGEEYYFNYSDEELISKIAEITVGESFNSEGLRDIFVLCPLSEKHNKFVHRTCYTDILRSSISVKDNLGYPFQVKDGKRVIHFCKMPLREALKIYKEIIKINPIKYANLEKIIEKISQRYRW